MDRLEAMSVVLAVAEAGSLSAAARQQKKPLATVSRKVTELEAHLQTKLFHRSSRALVATDAGRSYIAASKRILNDVAEAERAASGEYATPRGDLVVSAPFALGRMHLLQIRRPNDMHGDDDDVQNDNANEERKQVKKLAITPNGFG